MKRIQQLVNYYIDLLSNIDGDVLIYAKSSYVKIIFLLVGIYSPVGKKIIFVEDELSLEKYLISKNQNIIIFEGLKELRVNTSKYMMLKYNINAVFEVYHRHMLSNIVPPSTTFSVELIADRYQEVVIKTSGDTFIYDMNKDNIKDCSKYPWGEWEVIRFVRTYGEYSITYKNIASLLHVLHSEFKNKEQPIVDVSKLTFEEGFIYMLYFLETEHEVFFDDTVMLDNTPRLIFYGHKEVNFACCTNVLKTKIYKRFNVEKLNKYWLLKPILYIRNTIIIKRSYKLNKGDALYFLNHEFSILEKKTFKQSFVNVNFLFGTRNTSYVLGINTKEDKKVNIIDNEYRTMAWADSVHISHNSINQLMLSGDSVIESNIKHFTKFGDKDILYTNEGLYCEIKDDIIKIIANKEDIVYYKGDPINIGFIKKALMELPYIKDCILLVEKRSSSPIFIHPMVVVENSFILRQIMANKKSLGSIKSLLSKKKIELQEKVHPSVRILTIDVIDEFYLNKVRDSFESEYTFINYIAYRASLV